MFNPGGTNAAGVLTVGNLGFDFSYHSNLLFTTIANAAGPGAATLGTSSIIRVDPYFVPLNPPQPDPAADDLDDSDARLSAIARQAGNVIYAVDAIEVGVTTNSGFYSGQAAIRWYKINATNHNGFSATVPETAGQACFRLSLQ